MGRGYIRIKKSKDNQLIIEAKLVNCTLWMTKHEMADLLNVFVASIGNNLRAIFKSGLLREEDVTQIHKYQDGNRQCEVVLYNLEALIFVSYRISSYEARVFRQWVMKALAEYTRIKPEKAEVLIMYSLSSELSVVSLN
jgi:hypothetical protein